MYTNTHTHTHTKYSHFIKNNQPSKCIFPSQNKRVLMNSSGMNDYTNTKTSCLCKCSVHKTSGKHFYIKPAPNNVKCRLTMYQNSIFVVYNNALEPSLFTLQRILHNSNSWVLIMLDYNQVYGFSYFEKWQPATEILFYRVSVCLRSEEWSQVCSMAFEILTTAHVCMSFFFFQTVIAPLCQ